MCILAVHLLKRSILRGILMFHQPKYKFWQLKKMFAGHIKVLGGPHVARGPDFAQPCPRGLLKYVKFDVVEKFFRLSNVGRNTALKWEAMFL